MSTLIPYLAARADTGTFLLASELRRTIDELIPGGEAALPQPMKIYPANEAHAPVLGFPVAEALVMKELDAKLDRWITDEIASHCSRQPGAREKAQLSFAAYSGPLIKVAENALLSNVLNDYHAAFWLAHSFDLARQFASIPRRTSAVDTQIGRTQGDALKYRIYARWSNDIRDLMSQAAARASAVLDGEEQRSIRFLRLLQDDILLLTEEFIGPDLRELRSFINGYLRKEHQVFKDVFDRVRNAATELLQKDKTFRAALPLFGANPDNGISLALILDARFQTFLFEQQSVQNAAKGEEREFFLQLTRRLREFAVLSQLRRGIVFMTTTPDGHVISTDKRSSMAYAYSRATRPMDFGKPGVVDPMVHRFGLIYDISAFSETLGNIRRGGRKEEVSSYRQMLLFQRRLETIAQRHLLQFEKFLGDGAFYTTRRALRLVHAAVEIQRNYSEMKRKGFAFNKGLRIAINYGYYRLLPLRTGSDPSDRITEFYGPGIVELSRLTTGKANKEIEEIAAFLVSHGFEQQNVQRFFAPLERGVDLVDHTQHAREFYAYVDNNGHLVNEGIVGSWEFLQELSTELLSESQPLYRLRAPWGNYIGFAPSLPGLDFIGLRLIGMVSLKGLDRIEIGEIAPFASGEIEATPLDGNDPLVVALRQEYHQQDDAPAAIPTPAAEATDADDAPNELVVCGDVAQTEIVIGEWERLSDDVRNPLRLPRNDFNTMFAMEGELTTEKLTIRQQSVRDIYQQLALRLDESPLTLANFRLSDKYDAFVLGKIVEKL
ncbi:MAG: hypothetical protein JWO97_2450 [Acidobacteria bacterium]|nr:hypothetical protein [Acidobacteriota bacterium]